MKPILRTWRGGCHCGRVRYEVQAPQRLQVLACTCSICRMSGFLHLIVPAAAFRLLAGEDVLVDYRFGTGTARHRFCGICGIRSFYVPRSHPDGIDVDARCLEGARIDALDVSVFDDADRAAATAAISYLSKTDG